MKSAKLRFGLAAAAFAAWIGFLLYLVVTTRHPIVLSRPQFLVSTFDVIARVDDLKNPEVTIEEVHWPPDADRKGQKIKVVNLAECDGWDGPGDYILPLEPSGKAYQVVPTPRSPGFEPSRPGNRPRIYKDTPQTRRQLEEIPKFTGG
jgi:hypothetical protein